MKPKLGTSITALFMLTPTLRSPGIVALRQKRKSDRHRLCDDEGVPLICPTCQVLAQSVLTGDRLLLCMGLFSIFLVGGLSQARRAKVVEHGLLALADLVPGPPDSKSTSSRATNPNHP